MMMSDNVDDDREETTTTVDPTELFSTIENRIVQLKSKLDANHNNKGSGAGDTSSSSTTKFELIDRNDLRSKLREQFGALFGKHWPLLKRCLQQQQSKSQARQQHAATTNVRLTQETCVRLLTLSVQYSYEYAKQVAVEFNYFGERKNWLERFLLVAKSELREMCIEFLLSYLNYAIVRTTPG